MWRFVVLNLIGLVVVPFSRFRLPLHLHRLPGQGVEGRGAGGGVQLGAAGAPADTSGQGAVQHHLQRFANQGTYDGWQQLKLLACMV